MSGWRRVWPTFKPAIPKNGELYTQAKLENRRCLCFRNTTDDDGIPAFNFLFRRLHKHSKTVMFQQICLTEDALVQMLDLVAELKEKETKQKGKG